MMRSLLLLIALLLLASSTLCFSAPSSSAAAAGAGKEATTGTKDDKKIVLILGGNGFMGSYTVEALLREGSYSVYIANRNSTYFDSAARLQGVTQALYWDRRATPVASSKEMTAFFQQHPRLHAIVDFSCYDGLTARDLATFLINQHIEVGTYLYISTDSVYEVCI